MERADFGTPIFVRETLDEERHMSFSNPVYYRVVYRNGEKSSGWETMDEAKGLAETCYGILPDGEQPIAIEAVSKGGEVLSSEEWERPSQD